MTTTDTTTATTTTAPLYSWEISDRGSLHNNPPVAEGFLYVDDRGEAFLQATDAATTLAANAGTTVTQYGTWRGGYFTGWTRHVDMADGSWLVLSVLAV